MPAPPFAAVLVLALLAGLAAANGRTRRYAAADNGDAPLSAASSVLPAAAAAAFLSSSRAGIEGAQLVAVGIVPGKRGLTHVRFEQRAGGLLVVGAYAQATLDPAGAVVHALEGLVAAQAASGAAARAAAISPSASGAPSGGVSSAAAIAAAQASLGYGPGVKFYEAPSAERVLAERPSDGALVPAWEVMTWTLHTNQLHYTYVDQESGGVLYTEWRTHNDSYKVYLPSPISGTAPFVANGPPVISKPNGAGAGEAPSPLGWLYGKTQYTQRISGNNVQVAIDADGNLKPDKHKGSLVTDGNFLATADFSLAPSEGPNRDASVQNLFFLINFLHDKLYDVGFSEAAGNFQQFNFKRGGKGGDPVIALTQCGDGTNNAMFAAGRDGKDGRMVIFPSVSEKPMIQVGDAAYPCTGSDFGPAATSSTASGKLALATEPLACGPLPAGSLAGSIAVIDRGTCNFDKKVANAQAAGAVAVVVVNYNDTSFIMFGEGKGIMITSCLVSSSIGLTIKAAAGSTAKVMAYLADDSFDSDTVFHEYGHGLTSRIIRNMYTQFSGAVGEGASDVLAFLINNNPIVFEWDTLTIRAPTIRRYPYDKYPLTYANVTGHEIHDDGEIYAAAMWRVKENYESSGRTRDDLLEDWGMFMTPPAPTFTQMRDGLLDYITASKAPDAAARACDVWKGFAAFGIGEGATGSEALVPGKNLYWVVTVGESFKIPASCGGGVAPRPAGAASPDGVATGRRGKTPKGVRGVVA